MKRSILKSVLVVAAAGSLASCGILNKDSSGPGADADSNKAPIYGDADGQGCAQGVVKNGLTGERIVLPMSTREQGARVLVRGQIRSAVAHTYNTELDPAQDRLAGEFFICGIPMNQNFPLIVQIDGYMTYETEVTVASHDAAGRELAHPTANVPAINLFPEGTMGSNLEINVVRYGEPVANANVYLTPTGRALFASLEGKQDRWTPLFATTDEKGVVSFAKEDLLPGGEYTAKVIPTSGAVTDAREDTFYVGVQAPTAAGEEAPLALSSAPYKRYIALERTAVELEEKWDSITDVRVRRDGRIEVGFNQPIKLVPGAENHIIATLSVDGGGAFTPEKEGAELKDNDFSDPGMETCNVFVSDNDPRRLIMVPKWKHEPSQDRANEKDLVITYSGVEIMPADDNYWRGNESIAVDAKTVRFFARKKAPPAE